VFISTTKLRAVYQDAGIKQRVLSQNYLLTPTQLKKQHEGRISTYPQVLSLYRKGATIVWIDEAVFSCSPFKSLKVWSRSGLKRPQISIKKVNFEAVAVVAGIGADGRVLAELTWPKSINIPRFIDFLKKLVSLRLDPPVHLYVDQLQVHKSRAVKDFCANHGLVLNLAPIYDSPVNPIEFLWKLSKSTFRKRVVDFKVKKLDRARLEPLILDCISKSPTDALRRHVVKCMGRMQEWCQDNEVKI
jgi:transposase